MIDGQGNLIAPDGRLYPRVWVQVGRDFMRRGWSFALHWSLDDHAPEFCSVYRRSWGFNIHAIRN